jgi:hypothetical protein
MMGLKVGLLVVGLLAMVATPAMAQFSDPLTLATSGVLLPFFGTGNNVSVLEVASPVGPNPDMHFIFYDATCSRIVSVFDGLTTNDLDLHLVAGASPLSYIPGKDGLVAIGQAATNGIDLNPLCENPATVTGTPCLVPAALHSRVYWINVADSKFRVLEPIIVDTYELPSALSTWTPIRTGATFFAPLDNVLQTTLYLICPKDTIQGGSTSAFPTTRFPIPQGASTAFIFKSAYPLGNIRGRVYDTDENPLRNIQSDCNCVTTKRVTSFDLIYTTTDTYTELETDATFAGFTGYKAINFVGAPVVDLFGRLSNGNRLSLAGFHPIPSPPGCGGSCR